MRLLLDTHLLLWSALSPSRIAKACRDEIESPENEVFVSLVSGWEIAIKQSLGKLSLAKPAERWLPEVVRRSGFAWAPLGVADVLRVRGLPWHHRDPFDRLLIANAVEQGLTLATRDGELAAYDVALLRG